MYVSVGIYLVLLLTQGVKQRLIICLFLCVREWRRARGWVYDTVTEIEGKLCGLFVCVCVCAREAVSAKERDCW